MDHSHCFSCVSVRCTSKGGGCPVIICTNSCGTRLHQCKFDEHSLYTCWAARVQCVNATNGCEEVLPRRQLSQHLEHCPASIQKCSFSYDRRPDTSRQSSHHQPPNVLSEHRPRAVEEERLLDEKILIEDIALSRQKDKYIRCTDPTQRQQSDGSPPPFDTDILNNASTFISAAHRPKCFSKSNILRSRVCIQYATFSYEPFFKYQMRQSYCFPCNEIVRRDEFAAHWKDYHLTMQTGICFIIRRCPMFRYGCNYGKVQLAPDPNGACLSYNQEAFCFGLKLPVNLVGEVGETISEKCTQQIQMSLELAPEEKDGVLSQLPVEILMKISHYLDSLSLWNLSQVSHYIRNVCFNAVKKRGIVYWLWEKNATTKKWEQGPKVRIIELIKCFGLYIVCATIVVVIICANYNRP